MQEWDSDVEAIAMQLAYQVCAHGRAGEVLRGVLVDADSSWRDDVFARARDILLLPARGV